MPKRLIMMVSCARCGATWQSDDPPDDDVQVDLPVRISDTHGTLDLCAVCTKEFTNILDPWLSLLMPPQNDQLPPVRKRAKVMRPVVDGEKPTSSYHRQQLTSAPAVLEPGSDPVQMLYCRDNGGPADCERFFKQTQGVRMHQNRAHGMLSPYRHSEIGENDV